MIISDVTVGRHARGAMLSASLRPETQAHAPFRLEFVVRDEAVLDLTPSAEPFLACALLPAMTLGEALRVEGAVSARLLASLPTIQAIYRGWNTRLRVVDVQAGPSEGRRPAPGRALFFSGGVDSWYSLLKHSDGGRKPDTRLTHLILGFGFDVKLENRTLFDKIAAGVERVATATGLRRVVVETNVRQFSDTFTPWSLYHGSALAAVGLALSDLVGHCVISSTYAYGELHPWGSHPLLDPLWSTDAVTFEHDGCEAVRSEKVAAIARSPVALATLRVCWANDQADYNCGRCEKCIRTMLALQLAGALERCKSFDRPLTPDVIRRMTLGESSEVFLRDIVQALKERRGDRRLLRAVEAALRHRRWRTSAGHLARRVFGEGATIAAMRALFKPGLGGQQAARR